jgi:hypothetical protein
VTASRHAWCYTRKTPPELRDGSVIVRVRCERSPWRITALSLQNAPVSADGNTIRSHRPHRPRACLVDNLEAGHRSLAVLARSSLSHRGRSMPRQNREPSLPPNGEHLARLLAAVIVADLRRFPPRELCDISAVAVKLESPGSAS